jgi:hypothetical protein
VVEPAHEHEDLDPDAVRAMLSSYQDALDRFHRAPEARGRSTDG